MLGAFAITVSLLALNGALWAQDSQPAFEVASVKPNASGDRQSSFQVQPGGRILANNLAVRTLVSFAYQVQEYQVVGGPAWLDGERFDIVARPEGSLPAAPANPGGPPTQIQLMVRRLLSERFSLAVHAETREIPTYQLVLARADGRLGPQIRPSNVECVPVSAALPSGQRRCGFQLAPGSITAVSRTPSQLAGVLTQFVQRPVMDQTGLSGSFDLEMTWTPEALVSTQDLGPLVEQGSLFSAIQEQLGFRLQGRRQTAPVVVVDSVSRPSPD